MEKVEKVEKLIIPAMPISQIVYGELVYWITILSAIIVTVAPILAMLFTKNNIMNPNYTFGAIFAGKKIADVWALSKTGGFPGGHFYLQHLTTGDGLTQLGLVLGCCVALPGLIGAMFCYAREKSYGFVALSLWVGALVACSAIGIVNLH